MFSKACEYGIRAVIYIARQSMDNRRVGLREIAVAIDSPEAYTSKILQELSRHAIIQSDKGPTGGFSIDPARIKEIHLGHIVTAIDGDAIYKGCGLGLRECSEKMPCPVHFQFKKIRDDLKNMLESTTIKSLAEELEAGACILKR